MRKFGDLVKASVIYVFPISALILSLYAKETSVAARNALYLCIDVVIPSLFPFFVLSRLTIPYLSGFSCPKVLKTFTEKFFRLPYYALITIILGYLSGNPTGAKLARDMFDEGLLDSQKASKVIAIANNCSPLFVIGTIGAVLFKSVKIGFFLLLIHWTAGLIAAFFTVRIFKDKTSTKPELSLKPLSSKPVQPMKFSALVPFAVEEAAILCIKVTGYIVLFAVLSELLVRLGFFGFIGGFAGLFVSGATSSNGFSDLISSVMRGIMEIASGSNAINSVQDASMTVKLALISLICGFAGFSVHTQVMGIMKGTGAKYRVLFAGKLLHGCLAFILTLLVINLAPMAVETSTISASAFHNLSGIRVITIGVLILSLCVSPYSEEELVLRRKQVRRAHKLAK